jgi:membrane fusion protein (multidrug efflux system)
MSAGIFREAALEHHAEGDQKSGEILRLEKKWLTWSVRLILGAALAALVFSVVFDVTEYASGTAIVRIEGRRPVVTLISGVVETVHVQPGQHVEKDQVLVTLSSALEEAEHRRARSEFQLSLAALLRDPSDHNAKASLASLKPRRDSAAQIASARIIRAPHAGVMTDIRVRPGQYLTANEVVLGIAPLAAQASLVCLMPGEYRPMLSPGQPLRFALTGYKFEYRSVDVTSVGEEVVGPAEMKRYLGAELADSVELAGPTVLVKASLPSRTFTADGRTFTYVEGLTGQADVRVRKEPIIVLLVPSLKSLRHRR